MAVCRRHRAPVFLRLACVRLWGHAGSDIETAYRTLSEIEAIARAAGLLAKRVRAWKVGIQTLDQNWDTYRTPAGKKIVENALVKVILRVDDTAVPEICSALNLTEHHRDIMLSAGLGEGILIAENKAYHVYFQASRAELEMLTPHKKRKRGAVLDLPTARPTNAAAA